MTSTTHHHTTTETEETLEHLEALVTAMRGAADPVERARTATEIAHHMKHVVIPAMTVERQQVVRQLVRDGVSFSKIGKQLGISVSRVHQLVHGL